MKQVITMGEFCGLMSFNDEQAHDLIRVGAIETVRLGKERLVTIDSVNVLINNIEAYAQAEEEDEVDAPAINPAEKVSPQSLPRQRQLPPDLDCVNQEWANWGEEAITHFRKLSGSDVETAVRDLLTGIMHLCDREPELGKFEDEQAWARDFYDDTTRDYS